MIGIPCRLSAHPTLPLSSLDRAFGHDLVLTIRHRGRSKSRERTSPDATIQSKDSNLIWHFCSRGRLKTENYVSEINRKLDLFGKVILNRGFVLATRLTSPYNLPETLATTRLFDWVGRRQVSTCVWGWTEARPGEPLIPSRGQTVILIARPRQGSQACVARPRQGS
jgi:hypothetical protein